MDGQQRIAAITSFNNDDFDLLNPNDDARFKFPNFIKGDDCPWADKRFSELSETLQTKMMNYKLVVYEIVTDNENQIRDLFIRLQGGTPLTPQDKRDSWPGDFTDFVLTVGGKTTDPEFKKFNKWRGLPLFTEISNISNESRRRQLVAQIYMLYSTLQRKNDFCDISSSSIDNFYHSYVGFYTDSIEAKKKEDFCRICKKLYDVFQGKPRLFGHYLIHLVLLADGLLKEYVHGWEQYLANALYEFNSQRVEATKNIKEKVEDEVNRYYYEYAQFTKSSSDQAGNIRRRHAFFVAKMLNLLSPTKLDGKRTFSDLERQSVFFRDLEHCQWCKMKGVNHPVYWDDCEIHHVLPYAQGGKTEIKNAALVHRECHPKSSEDVTQFSGWWRDRQTPQPPSGTQSPSRKLPPDGTKIRSTFHNVEYRGEIKDKKITFTLNGELKICNSLSTASKMIIGRESNGWTDWYFCLPGEEDWILANDWRKRNR